MQTLAGTMWKLIEALAFDEQGRSDTSLQRRSGLPCAISGPMRHRTARFQFNPETKSPARCP